MGTFDRWSTVVVPRWGRCVVQSFTPSGAPPTRQKQASAARNPDRSKILADPKSWPILLRFMDER
jgi:hypothetical protein